MKMREESSDDSYPKKNLQIQNHLRVAVATWNLQGTLPPHNSLKLLFTHLIEDGRNDKPDILAIGTQECQRTLAMSFFCEDKQEWENMLTEVAHGYTLAASETLQGLHLGILVRKKLMPCFTVQKISVFRAGTCNLLGNKGAVSITLNLLGQNMQFINCHLAAQQNQSERRNQTLISIAENLVDRDFRTQAFIFGDLNYRIDMTKEEYSQLLASKGVAASKDGKDDQSMEETMGGDGKKRYKPKPNTEENVGYTKLIARDQLMQQEILKQRFLTFFHEQPITFPPTYKISNNSPQYKASRIPGWTDRIFLRKSRARQLQYKCLYNIYGSDHRPVVSAYEMDTEQGLSIFPDDYVQVKSSACQLI